MFPAGFIVASGFTIMLLVIWIRSLKREWQQLEEESERQTAQETEPKLQPILILMPDKQVKYGLKLGSVEDVKALVAKQNKKKKAKKGKVGPKMVEIDITDWLSGADVHFPGIKDEDLLMAAAEMLAASEKQHTSSLPTLEDFEYHIAHMDDMDDTLPAAEQCVDEEEEPRVLPAAGQALDSEAIGQAMGQLEETGEEYDDQSMEQTALLGAGNSSELVVAEGGVCTANAQVQLGDSMVGASCSITFGEGCCEVSFGCSPSRACNVMVEDAVESAPLVEKVAVAAA